jgi:hypothetical protein
MTASTTSTPSAEPERRLYAFILARLHTSRGPQDAGAVVAEALARHERAQEPKPAHVSTYDREDIQRLRSAAARTQEQHRAVLDALRRDRQQLLARAVQRGQAEHLLGQLEALAVEAEQDAARQVARYDKALQEPPGTRWTMGLMSTAT